MSVDIDINSDLEQVTTQIEAMVGQLTKLNNDRDSLAQQIHNLNGIAMYLRGKQTDQPGVPEVATEEYPPPEGE
tara:strand:+ start:398 stop:619 length:222 start_codon:yes stop_codon:yes gene_type:complete